MRVLARAVTVGFLIACSNGTAATGPFEQITISRTDGPGTSFLGTVALEQGLLPANVVEQPTWPALFNTTDGSCDVYVPGTSNATLWTGGGTINISGSPSGVMAALGPNAGAAQVGPLAMGDVVTVSGVMGSNVPAFTLTSPLPPNVQVTSPLLTMPYTINRSSDLTLNHSTSGSGQFFVQITQQSPAISMMCTYPAATAVAMIKASTLARLTPDGAGKTDFYYGTFSRAMSTAGNVTIIVSLNDYLRTTVFVQ